MKARFLASARRELLRAADWYDDRIPGLGDRFLDEIGKALRRILDFPEAHPALDVRYRRCLLAVFPFSIIYRVQQGHVVIIAVAHMSRRPG